MDLHTYYKKGTLAVYFRACADDSWVVSQIRQLGAELNDFLPAA